MSTDDSGLPSDALDAAPAIALAGGLLASHGTVAMTIGDGGEVARTANLKIPKGTFKARPTTLATIYSQTSPGDPYCVYSIIWADHPRWLLCKITAQAAVNHSANEYFCDYLLIGA